MADPNSSQKRARIGRRGLASRTAINLANLVHEEGTEQGRCIHTLLLHPEALVFSGPDGTLLPSGQLLRAECPLTSSDCTPACAVHCLQPNSTALSFAQLPIKVIDLDGSFAAPVPAEEIALGVLRAAGRVPDEIAAEGGVAQTSVNALTDLPNAIGQYLPHVKQHPDNFIQYLPRKLASQALQTNFRILIVVS